MKEKNKAEQIWTKLDGCFFPLGLQQLVLDVLECTFKK